MHFRWSQEFLPLLLYNLNIATSYAAIDIGYDNDLDLHNFVTRPEIKAPRLNIKVHDKTRTSPGFIFTAPFVDVYQLDAAPKYYEACQTGPHIYDCDGNLVWSGACLLRNKNVADFRVAESANRPSQLSFIQMDLNQSEIQTYGNGRSKGYGIVLDETYTAQARVQAPHDVDSFNMHEFKVVDEGRSALQLLWKPQYADISELGSDRLELMNGRTAGWVGSMGFREFKLDTGVTEFEWWFSSSIKLTESSWPTINVEGPAPFAWDYFHANAIDKNANGDYLVSARHTNCIYKISARQNKILWRLGGKMTSFPHQDFDFSRQHSAAFVMASQLGMKTKPNVDYITFIDNGSDELGVATSDSSSALVVEVNETKMQARLIRRIVRPDGGSSIFGGNSQIQSNGNFFASWGGSTYLSEYTPHGDLVLEASFLSSRFQTYRAYKQIWKAKPSTTELVLKCSAYGTSQSKATTVCYVSWNGATEVVFWQFHFLGEGLAPSVRSKAKDGFETNLHKSGYFERVFVEAIGRDGHILARSSEEVTGYWSGCILAAASNCAVWSTADYFYKASF